jgi:hypothetical protein
MSDIAIDEKPKLRAHVSRFVWHVLIDKTLLVTSWLAPFIIKAMGYLFFQPLRDRITLPWQTVPDIWAGTLFCTVRRPVSLHRGPS